MSKENCIKKGYHEYSTWRKLEDSRVFCDINGLSYKATPFSYYVRNCKHCDAIEAALNSEEKEVKTKNHIKAKKLVLASRK